MGGVRQAGENLILCTESNLKNYSNWIFRNLIIRSINFVK